MLSNMACSLIEHKRINTTLAKAKALKQYVEPLISKSKADSTHSRRIVFGYLQDKYATSELFRDIAPKVGDRPGGYTRIIKLGNRAGDSAELCMIELVDYNELLLGDKEPKKKTTRRGRSKKSDSTGEVVEAVATDAKTEEVVAKKAAPKKKAVKAEDKVAPKAEEKKKDSSSDEDTKE